MVDLVVFLLISYGASNIMIYGSNFEGWRNFWKRISPNFFYKLFTCFICLPFWWGVILSLTMHSPSFWMNGDEVFTLFGWMVPSDYLATFFDGCLASGGVWLINSVQEMTERVGGEE